MTSSKLPYRMIMSYRISLICSALLLLPSIALAGNWSHWRGPSGNGSSSDAKPPVEWSATKNVKWKVLIPGRGSGSPVIWEDKVFVVTAVCRGWRSGVRRGKLVQARLQDLLFRPQDRQSALGENSSLNQRRTRERTLRTDSLRHHLAPMAPMSMPTSDLVVSSATPWTVNLSGSGTTSEKWKPVMVSGRGARPL